MIMQAKLIRSNDAKSFIDMVNSFLSANPGVTLTDAHYATAQGCKWSDSVIGEYSQYVEYSVLIFYYPAAEKGVQPDGA